MRIVGRDADLSALVERLRHRRLVTVTGPGGIGKTALATAAAAVVAPDFAMGAITVDLTRVDEPDGVYEAIAGQLGYADFDSLMNSPSDQPALIVIDNCEHVLDAAADATERMLAACEMPTILATSRAPLDVADESLVSLGPLRTPPDEGIDYDVPAMELMLERARDHGAEINDHDLTVLASICRRLDGVPLAIELAAARLRAVSPRELQRELDERPHALARRRFRGQSSHRSVAETVAWSTDLLGPGDSRFFLRLAVFAGPFTPTMAHAVAADPDDEVIRSRHSLEELLAASLVVVERSVGSMWYRLLHPVRAVALDRLASSGELEAMRSRFVDQVVALAVDVIARTTGSWDSSALNDLIALYDNIAASIRWLLVNDDHPDRALTLVAVLWGLVHQTHTAEIRELGEAVLTNWPEPNSALWPDAVATVATCRTLTGDYEGSITLAKATLSTAGSSPFAPATLRRVLAQTYRILGEPDRSRRTFAEGADIAASAGIHGFAMELWVDVAMLDAQLGDFEGALALADRVHAEAVERGSSLNEVWADAGRARILLDIDPSRALAEAERALAGARAHDYPAGRSCALRVISCARFALGDDAGAARALLDLLDELLSRGGLHDLRLAIDTAAAVLEHYGHERWADLAVTAASLPVTTVMVPIDQEIFTRGRAAGGSELSIRESYQVCRTALGSLSTTETGLASAQPPLGSPSRDAISSTDGAAIEREGDVVRLTFDGTSIRLKASKGLDDMAKLLSRPGREISALDLMGASGTVAVNETPLLDTTARQQYEQRIRDLQVDIDRAESDNNLGRLEQLRVEHDFIVEELTSALGLGGRTRTTTSDAERARSAVTQRIRATIKRVEGAHPALGAHLRDSVATGTFCVYRPDRSVDWSIGL